MNTISSSKARASLSGLMDQVSHKGNTVVITRRGGSPAVLMALKDYQSWQETLHLLRSPANAQRLLDSLVGQKPHKARRRKIAS